jgi:hypothetical protein
MKVFYKESPRYYSNKLSFACNLHDSTSIHVAKIRNVTQMLRSCYRRLVGRGIKEE